MVQIAFCDVSHIFKKVFPYRSFDSTVGKCYISNGNYLESPSVILTLVLHLSCRLRHRHEGLGSEEREKKRAE